MIDKIKKSLYIYKVCPFLKWKKALVVGKFYGYGIDLIDGYIHFSLGHQVEKTLELHFNKQKGLCLLEVSTENLDIKWEKARDNQLFPHLYDELNVNFVTQVIILSLSKNNVHILPILK